MSNSFEMFWVNTVPMAATSCLDVVEFEAFGHLADQQFIGVAMGGAVMSSDEEARVAVVGQITSPQPAAVRAARINLPPEPGGDIEANDGSAFATPASLGIVGVGTLSLHRRVDSFGVMQPDVDASRLPSFYHLAGAN